jgi:hypothetical protein
MARDGVVLERVHGEVLAVARGLQPAMRHLVHQHEVGVDPGAAIMKPRGRGHALTDVRGPHGFDAARALVMVKLVWRGGPLV